MHPDPDGGGHWQPGEEQLPVRLVGSVDSAEDGRVATGLKGAGADKLMWRGDFLLVLKGKVPRSQAAYVSDEEIRQILERLRHGERTSGRWPAEVLMGRGTGHTRGHITGYPACRPRHPILQKGISYQPASAPVE